MKTVNDRFSYVLGTTLGRSAFEFDASDRLGEPKT